MGPQWSAFLINSDYLSWRPPMRTKRTTPRQAASPATLDRIQRELGAIIKIQTRKVRREEMVLRRIMALYRMTERAETR